MAASKKPSNSKPKPPVQGPPAPGEYRIEFMDAGKWQATLGGKSVPQRRSAMSRIQDTQRKITSSKGDSLSGLTSDAGTQSLLKGMLQYLRGPRNYR
jgi:hypothetical protein